MNTTIIPTGGPATAPAPPPKPTVVELPTGLAPTCPSCESHNISNGSCGDCGLTDDAAAFTGAGMTANARFQPSLYGRSNAETRKFPRAFTISGGVD